MLSNQTRFRSAFKFISLVNSENFPMFSILFCIIEERNCQARNIILIVTKFHPIQKYLLCNIQIQNYLILVNIGRKQLTINQYYIRHIGKESNNLDESELFGLNDSSYEIYHDESNIDEKFRQIAPKILELKPKDVKEFGISKQTLTNVKNNIRNKHFSKISKKIKYKLIYLFFKIGYNLR